MLCFVCCFDVATMRQDFCVHLSVRPAFLSTTQLPYDGLLQSPERFADVLRETDMDVLSEVLKVVKLQGAMFYNGEFSAPWSFRSPASCNVAPFVAAGAEHVIIYHLLTEGHASAQCGRWRAANSRCRGRGDLSRMATRTLLRTAGR